MKIDNNREYDIDGLRDIYHEHLLENVYFNRCIDEARQYIKNSEQHIWQDRVLREKLSLLRCEIEVALKSYTNTNLELDLK
jgi:hypothetical protein